MWRLKSMKIIGNCLYSLDWKKCFENDRHNYELEIVDLNKTSLSKKKKSESWTGSIKFLLTYFIF